MANPQQTDANLNLANPKQAVVGTAAVPAATLYDVYAQDTPQIRRDLGLPSRPVPPGLIAQRAFVRFSKLGPEGAAGAVIEQYRTNSGKGENVSTFVLDAAGVAGLLEHVSFIDEPPPWPEGQTAPPAPAPITPVQARAQGTGVGAFFRAYKWPILGGVGVLALGAAWFFTRKK